MKSFDIRNVYALLFRNLNVRNDTLTLVQCIIWELPLTPETQKLFGNDTADHYKALDAILFGFEDATDADEAVVLRSLKQRIEALDAACGSGQRLNALMLKYAPEYADRVHFTTHELDRNDQTTSDTPQG